MRHTNIIARYLESLLESRLFDDGSPIHVRIALYANELGAARMLVGHGYVGSLGEKRSSSDMAVI